MHHGNDKRASEWERCMLTFEHVVLWYQVFSRASIITCSSQNVLRKNHTKLKVNVKKKRKRTELCKNKLLHGQSWDRQNLAIVLPSLYWTSSSRFSAGEINFQSKVSSTKCSISRVFSALSILRSAFWEILIEVAHFLWIFNAHFFNFGISNVLVKLGRNMATCCKIRNWSSPGLIHS